MKAVLSEPAIEVKKASVSRSVGKMLIASIVSAITGIVLVLWVPRLLSVEDFGYWRTFLLYAGYAGFLHLGMVDGALLDWSRPGESRAGSAFPQALRVLTVQHLVVTTIGLVLFATPLAREPHFKSILVALLAYAAVFNLLGLVQVHLQARHRFSAVAFTMAGPGVFFVLALAALRLWSVTLQTLLLAYLVAWAATLAVIWVSTRRADRKDYAHRPPTDAPSGVFNPSARHIRAGWAIMLANTSYGLMQSADRITVNLTQPIHDFAIYSLSQSTIYVPITIIAAVSRVAFSHFAEVTEGGRERTYRKTVNLLTMLWIVLLPYYFLVEWVVRRFLPRYVPGLGAGKILLLSVLFLSLISIVQANAFKLSGQQRRFFFGSLAAVAVAFLTAWIGSKAISSRWINSLTAIAWSQVVSAALWWLGNEIALRRSEPLPLRETARVLVAFLSATAGLYIASLGNMPTLLRAAAYYAMLSLFCLMFYGEELRRGWRRMSPIQWSTQG